MFPFKQTQLNKNSFIRTFDEDVDVEELVWHMDKSDRTLSVINNSGHAGWKLQMDNCMPETLTENKSYIIPKNVFHRVIKGEGKLVVEIKETYE